mgnify:CR=1 FL=1
MLTLYFSPGTCALATHIALEEAGADYALSRIDFGKDEQNSPEFLKLNPKGRVPALVTDDGVLTETPALLAWVAQTWPEAKLAPLDDAFRFAEVQAVNSYLCSTVHVAHAHGRRGYRWADDPAAHEAMRAKLPASMSACFQTIEDSVLEGPWMFGETYTIADPYLFTIARWLEVDGVDIAKFPKVAAHFEAMHRRPAVAAALKGQGL